MPPGVFGIFRPANSGEDNGGGADATDQASAVEDESDFHECFQK
jgi:hypothetical protein